MKHIARRTLAAIIFSSLFTLQGMAQTNLAGRVYHHPNILADEINQAASQIPKTKEEAIAKAEKKKGRKLTEKEKAELMEKLAQVEVVKKGMSIGLTVEFKNATEVVMRQKTRVTDEALKVAGVGWAKRKAMKAMLAVMPESMSGTYTVAGNRVVVTDKEGGKDTMLLSADGKYLTGLTETRTSKGEKQSFKLIRTK